MRHLFFAIFLLLFSCQPKETTRDPSFAEQKELEKGEKAIIEGKILNREVYPHIAFVKLTMSGFDNAQTELTTPIDSAGQFRFEFYPLTTREIALSPLEDVIIISPCDSLFIEKDFTQISKSVFSGTNSTLNNQISAFRNQYLGRYNFDYELAYMDFKKACDGQKNVVYQKLKTFSKQYNTSDIFAKWAEKQIELDYYKALFEFPYQHYLRTKEPFSKQEEYFAFLPEMEKQIDDSFILADYFEVADRFGMLKAYGEYLYTNPKASEVIKTANEELPLLLKSSKNIFLSQLVTAAYLNRELKGNKTTWMDKNMEAVDGMITHPFLRSSIQQRYNQVKTFNANPRIYSDAVMGKNAIEISGRGFQLSDSAHITKHILDKNPGNVVYVDIWASWCPGCIVSFPHSKKLSEYFEGKTVTFAYLCMGGTPKTWKKTVEKYELSGLHHYCSDVEWLDLLKRFNIKGIPYYLLFDKKGVLVDFGLHLRPDMPETKASIESLLIK